MAEFFPGTPVVELHFSVGGEAGFPKGLVDFFFAQRSKDIHDLATGAFEAFIRHEEGTLVNLVALGDPYREDVLSRLPELTKTLSDIKADNGLGRIPTLKTAKRSRT